MKRLKAAAAIVGLGLALAAAADPARIQIQSGDLSVTIQDADRPILEYVHGPELFKPYVKHLFTPGGVNVLLDSPPDHIHHHGLMFAVGIDGVDFWAETGEVGRQRGVRFGESSPRCDGTTVLSGLAETLDCIGPKDPKPLVREGTRGG